MNRQSTALWNAKQERVALLIASGRTIKDAAAEAGAGERTVHTWLEDQAYRAHVSALRGRLLDEAVGRLAGCASEAVATLAELLGEDQPAVRLRAALGILDQLIRVRQHAELDERITNLEKLAHERDESA